MPDGVNAVWEWLTGLAPPAVWAALGGLILGVVTTYWARGIEQRRQRRDEIADLLRLLRSEVKQNEELLRTYTYEPGLVTDSWRRPLSLQMWDRTNSRLSQLLGDEELLADLTEYYEEVRAMHDLILRSGYSTTTIEKIVRQELPELKELSNHVMSQLEDDRRRF